MTEVLMLFSAAKLEQLEAFRQKKAREKLDRMERIQKRLQQLRGQPVAVGRGQPNKGNDASRKQTARPKLKDATNSSAITAAKPELTARAMIVARRLKNSSSTDGVQPVGSRRLTVTLPGPSEATDVADASQRHYETVKSSIADDGDAAADENIPQHHGGGKNCKPRKR